ncbi:hypothetical protein MAR_004719, partial [Mya arenaria]
MRNLTDKLVNGLQGYVTGITEDGPVVKFAGNEVPIKKLKCTVFSPLKNMDVAVREQYPLKLAFAISIHKSQGMTLDRSSQPQKLTITVPEMVAIDDAEYDDATDNEEFDDEFDKDIRQIGELQNQNDNIELPEDLNIENIIESIHCQHVVTTHHFNTNKILEDLDKNKVKRFVQNEYLKLKSFLEPQQEAVEVNKMPASKQSEFYHKVHLYHTSVEFRLNCLSFFDISKIFTEKKVDLLTISNRPISKRTVTNASMARIRYIGGYCIAKSIAAYEDAVICVDLLSELKEEIREKFYNGVKQNCYSSYSNDTLESHCEIIYKKIIKQHLMVMLNQYRKDILESFNVEKKMSHRKQIQLSKPAGKGKGK